MFTLDGYDILEKIGTGGMATVWKARQRSLDRLVAIKVLSKDLALSPEDIRRFREEAQTAAQIRHSGIVQIYDVMSQDDTHCFVMELVNGYTVGEWIRRSKTLSEPEILLIADYVAMALEYAWQHYKMVHCDIKPDNVMVDADGSIKLTDFGLSRVQGRHYEADDIFGTPPYISPEQALGAQDLDCRTDMYSLGAMMYHLASGKMMFEGEPDEVAIEKQVYHTVPSLRTLNPALSESFCQLVEKLLYKDRRIRYASWQRVRADIAAASNRRPLPSGVPMYNRSTMKSSASTAEALRSQILTGRAETPRSNAWLWMLVLGVVVAALAFGARVMVQKGILRIPGLHSKTESSPYIKALYEEACLFEKEHPGRLREALTYYERVVNEGGGTEEAALSKEHIERLEEEIAAKSPQQ